MEYEHLPMLRNGISGWITKATNAFQTECFDTMNKHTENENWDENILEKELRVCAERIANLQPPAAIFAFASLLIADINSRLKFNKQPKLKTMINFDNYQKRKSSAAPPTNSLSHVMSLSLKKLTKTLLEEEKLGTIQPAGQRLSSIFNESKVVKGSIQPDSTTLHARSKQHSSEQLLNSEQTVDALSTDLHRIFLRIAFHSLTPQLLSHMVYYNYPLSVHCATLLFDSTVHLLKEIGAPLHQFDIVLYRGTARILKYSVNLSLEKNLKKLIIELDDSCFYVVEKTESMATNRKNPIGLFQALREKMPQFADRYIVDSINFMKELSKVVEQGKEAPAFWKRNVEWFTDDKLLCPVAI
ncbi:hypothetical protein WR25_14912 [Diploscapter pachys]|uniref:Uncharacterized protein n=1 Tax=Diploscapter pachys TaxID=2018661 RepID=A0A2A2J2X1_9BILA|nr:hypothetical protein WR25_14912 [Diploscapter pachys]